MNIRVSMNTIYNFSVHRRTTETVHVVDWENVYNAENQENSSNNYQL